MELRNLSDYFDLLVQSSTDTYTPEELISARQDFMTGAASALNLLSHAKDAEEAFESMQHELIVHAKDVRTRYESNIPPASMN